MPGISLQDRDLTLPKLLLQLGKNVDKTPAEWICRGVRKGPIRNFDYAPGGIADVFKGNLNKQVVALKRPRYNLSMSEDELDLQVKVGIPPFLPDYHRL